MKRNLSTRLTVRVGIPAALLFAVIIGIAAQRSFQRLLLETERASRQLARQEGRRRETQQSRAAKIPEMIALQVESGSLKTEPELEAYLRSAVLRNPEIYGSCLAFEPNSFSPEKRWYGPYYYWKEGVPEFVQLGNPDYDYLKWAWYTAPKASQRAMWSEPYFDDGGGNTIMTTYSVPFWRERQFWGIATIDIALSQLIERVAQIHPGRTGYALIVSKQGRFLAFPDRSLLMRGRIQDINQELARRMMAGEDGFMRTLDPASRREAWVAFVPIQQGAFSLAFIYPEAELVSEAFRLQVELLALGLTGLLVLLVGLHFIARAISRPIQNLAEAAREVASGRLDFELSPGAATLDEVASLTTAFNKMTRDLQLRMEELRQTTAISERLQGELSGARSIQMSLLPKVFPAFPQLPEIDIHAQILPAREVGGDFYNFHLIDSHRLCLSIGDVSGKGIPAALFMAVTQTLLKANSASLRPPNESVALVNRQIHDQAAGGMFVTLVFAVLDCKTGLLQLCNAGHLAPLIVDSRGGVRQIPAQSGTALGLLRDSAYEICQQQLSPGDTLVFVTDGITEAMNPARQFYSFERLQRTLARLHASPLDSLTQQLVEDVQAFADGREQFDDIAVLALRWCPHPLPTTM